MTPSLWPPYRLPPLLKYPGAYTFLIWVFFPGVNLSRHYFRLSTLFFFASDYVCTREIIESQNSVRQNGASCYASPKTKLSLSQVRTTSTTRNMRISIHFVSCVSWCKKKKRYKKPGYKSNINSSSSSFPVGLRCVLSFLAACTECPFWCVAPPPQQ